MTGTRPTIWRRLRAIDEVGVVVALLSVCLLLTLSTGPQFAQTGNLLQVARQASSYGILSVGMVLLLSMGEIDLSVGAILTLVNIVTALALRERLPLVVAILAGLATGAGCGLVNGLLGFSLRVPSIIITLGTMSIYRGLALVFSKATPIGNFSKDNLLFDLGSHGPLGVPTSVWLMLIMGALGHAVLHHTAFGWRAQAIGSNAQAARFSGIPLARYRVLAMTLIGIDAFTFPLFSAAGASLGLTIADAQGSERGGLVGAYVGAAGGVSLVLLGATAWAVVQPGHAVVTLPMSLLAAGAVTVATALGAGVGATLGER